MKTEFIAWVILREGSRPLEKFVLQGGLGSVLVQASRKMRLMGSSIAEARNLSWFMGSPSILVHDPSFPLAVVITGAQITGSEGIPLKGEEASTGLSSLIEPISE